MIERNTTYWPLLVEINFFQTVYSYLWFSQAAELGKMSIIRDFTGYVVVFSCYFFVVPILGALWALSIGDKGDLDLDLCQRLVISFGFFMFDVGEDLRSCGIGLCEATALGKGFGYDDEVFLLRS